MSVQAKMRVERKVKTMGFDIHDNKPAPVYEVHMTFVTTGSKESEEFFAATPGGELKMYVLNSKAADQLEPGDEVYVTITKADK